MLKRIPIKKLTGSEQFKNTGNNKFSVLDFWRYGFSNLNSNVLRGALAEFIVENALRESAQIDVRNPWANYDVESPDGRKIEVKCCSYIQDWDQNDFSRIVWTGLKARELYWSDAVKKHSDLGTSGYKSDVYVLALLKHKDPDTLGILDMGQWCFYILSSKRIKDITKDGNSVSLKRLEKLGVAPVGFHGIAKAVSSAR